MTVIYNAIYFTSVFLFGVAVSVCFAGIPLNRKNMLTTLAFCMSNGLLQLVIFSVFGISSAQKLYPLMTHLPLILFIMLIYHRSLLNSVTSVMTAYLCCQIPKWCSLFFNVMFHNALGEIIIYEITALLTFYILYYHITKDAQILLKQTKKTSLLLCIVPLCYYIFDYSTTIYTNLLYSGNVTAVQFMPSVCCIFYVVFIIYYCRELTLQEEARRQADSLNLQLEYAAITLDNMRAMQAQTIAYRHDLRHHCTYLQSLALAGDLEKIKQYIHSMESDIEAFTPKRYCQNELMNLILSSYFEKAKKKQITLDIRVSVPNHLSISDTRLCSVLSNALENALDAAEKTTDKWIQIQSGIHHSALLLQISNPYTGTVTYHDHMPISREDGHGFGTKSIANIVDSYNGQYEFHTKDQVFTVRILLPLIQADPS